jgi:hypothetical protein
MGGVGIDSAQGLAPAGGPRCLHRGAQGCGAPVNQKAGDHDGEIDASQAAMAQQNGKEGRE